jgi:glycine/D-amino acid oxidase-like deaminating enzyme
VLVAAGRWTDGVAALAGVRVPLAPTSGLLAVTAPFDTSVSRVVYAPGMNFRPDPSGGLVLQSGETDAMVSAETPPDPTHPGCARLLERLSRFLPAAGSTHIAAARVGTRPMPADGLSIVGPVDARPGLYLSITHSGITLAPLLAEIAAAELTTGAADPRLTDFRPSRCVTVED